MSRRLLISFVIFIALMIYFYSTNSNHLSDSSKVKADTIQVDTPKSISIPSIDLNSGISFVGLTDKNTVDVPDINVGWYQFGPKPGETGMASLDGHFVDHKFKPAVFYKLNQLKAGDDIFINDSSNHQWHFRVTKTELVDTDDFPTETVYGNYPKAGLNLITCAGTYDHTVQNFNKRTIVYSELVN